MLKLTVKPLILSAAFALSLTGGMNIAGAEEMEAVGSDLANGIVLKQAADHDSNYCHIKYMAFTERSLKSGDLEFHPTDVIDSYGSCAFNPKGSEEVQKQLSMINRGMNDGSNDSDSGE
jgi:hypothetical protein